MIKFRFMSYKFRFRACSFRITTTYLTIEANKKATCNSGLNQWLLSGKYAMAQLFNLMFCLYL